MSKRVTRPATSSSGRPACSTVSGVGAGVSLSPVVLSTTGKRSGRASPRIEPSRGTAASSARV